MSSNLCIIIFSLLLFLFFIILNFIIIIIINIMNEKNTIFPNSFLFENYLKIDQKLLGVLEKFKNMIILKKFF